MEIKYTKIYGKFYVKYTKRRDRIIFWYLKRLRAKSRVPVTMENKDKVLKDRARYERFAQAYWDTRLANRPFINAKPVYANRETPDTRTAYRRFVEKVWK